VLIFACLLGAGLASARLLPAVEFMDHSGRPAGANSIADIKAGANSQRSVIAGMLTPEPLNMRYSDLMRRVYVGSLTLVLALIGLVGWTLRVIAIAIASAGVAAAWYSLGVGSSLYPILLEPPLGSWFRGPDRASILTGFSVAFLSGAGLDYLLAQSVRFQVSARSPVFRSIALLTIAISSVLFLQWWLGSSGEHSLAIVYAVTGAVLLGLLCTTKARRLMSIVILLLAGVIFFDLSHVQPHPGMRPAQLAPHYERNVWLYDWIREHQKLSRRIYGRR
jgi:hypothetical protein